MDEERILVKIAQVEEYLKELSDYLPETEQEYLESHLTQRAVERILQLIIENIIDICALLVKEFQLGPPSDEDNIFQLLEGKITMVETLKSIKGFRNVLVHKYGELDSNKVYHIASEQSGDFWQFLEEVKILLQQN
ncbi:MAG TPA: DUF86 domain-containing protein [Candidatus Lokiarchaeia archaeon]|nr:DUF86 domain-containing protein [Candidatus Lokiarchaeia archaeon]